MTKKEISTMFDIFIKAHKPDEFKSPDEMSFWDDLYIKIARSRARRPSQSTIFNMRYTTCEWWMNGKSPMLESEIIETLDIQYVTYGYAKVHGWRHVGRWETEFLLSNVVDDMFDLSFKYNIIGIRQRPGDFEMWLKESPDHQSNITGEVIEKIAKCLEF